MALECAKCGKKPNIKINVLNYCNGCFLSNIKHKSAKLLNGMLHSTPILVYVAPGPAGVVLCDILSQFFASRKYYTVLACTSSETEAYDNVDFAQKQFSLNNLEDVGCDRMYHASEPSQMCKSCKAGLPHALMNYAKAHNIKTIIYARDLETTLATALGWICKGSGVDAVESSSVSSIDDVILVNPFSNIRDKEIVYYVYIQGLKVPECIIRPPNKVDGMLRDFLHETDSKNSLALFNMLSIIKRIS